MAMTKLSWKTWHEVVKLRDDLRSGDLPLHIFAADLYEVMMGSGKRPIYEKPEEFFALTFPTHNLRGLVRDVVLRLAGKNDKAVRQLELTYGGGKTHTLITMRHLVNDPDNLPDLPAVREFIETIGQTEGGLHRGGVGDDDRRVACLFGRQRDVEIGDARDAVVLQGQRCVAVAVQQPPGDDADSRHQRQHDEGGENANEWSHGAIVVRAVHALPWSGQMMTVVRAEMSRRTRPSLDHAWIRTGVPIGTQSRPGRSCQLLDQMVVSVGPYMLVTVPPATCCSSRARSGGNASPPT